VTTGRHETSNVRRAVFDALRAAAPHSVGEEMRATFLAGGSNLSLAELDLDSLSQMELCIAIELSTGVSLLPSELAELRSTEAIERRIAAALNGSPRAGSPDAHTARDTGSRRRAPGRLDQALRLYRRRIARCRTDNQRNKLHIALENYMTPMEVRHFAAALADEAPEEPGRIWITDLEQRLPRREPRTAEFVRSGLCKGATYYTASSRPKQDKTLLLAFAGHFQRLMAPTPPFLDALDPELYDVVMLRDFAQAFFARGIPGLGGDLAATLSELRHEISLDAYRNCIALGTSSGGLIALLAAIELRLARGISIGGLDFPSVAARLERRGLSAEPYASLLAARPEPFPELLLVFCGGYRTDAAAANALRGRIPSRLWPVKGCRTHSVIGTKLASGRLPAFLARLLGQPVARDEATPVPLPSAASSVHEQQGA